MPRIRCLYLDCVFLEDKYCTAPSVEIDPDVGCETYAPAGGLAPEEKWDGDESLDDWDAEDLEDDEDGDVDDWLDEI